MNEYQIAAIACFGVMVFWFVAYLLCGAIQRAWAWVDDSKPSKNNALVKKLAEIRGYEIYDDI